MDMEDTGEKSAITGCAGWWESCFGMNFTADDAVIADATAGGRRRYRANRQRYVGAAP